MKNRILIISSCSEDIKFSCGGTILKHQNEGDEVSCVTVLPKTLDENDKNNLINISDQEIDRVNKFYNFSNFIKLHFLPKDSNSLSLTFLMNKFNKVIGDIKPNIIYLPYISTLDSNVNIIRESITNCPEFYQSEFLNKIISYKSNSQLCVRDENTSFIPNLWIDIESYLQEKIEIVKTCKNIFLENSNMNNEKYILSLSIATGSSVGLNSAESFMILRENN